MGPRCSGSLTECNILLICQGSQPGPGAVPKLLARLQILHWNLPVCVFGLVWAGGSGRGASSHSGRPSSVQCTCMYIMLGLHVHAFECTYFALHVHECAYMYSHVYAKHVSSGDPGRMGLS